MKTDKKIKENVKSLLEDGTATQLAVIHSKDTDVYLLELLQPCEGIRFNMRYSDTSTYFSSLKAMLSYGIGEGLFGERTETLITTKYNKQKES